MNSLFDFRTRTGAPPFVGWRFVSDGNRQGFFDYRLTRPEDLDNDILPPDHPAWLDQDDDGWYHVRP